MRFSAMLRFTVIISIFFGLFSLTDTWSAHAQQMPEGDSAASLVFLPSLAVPDQEPVVAAGADSQEEAPVEAAAGGAYTIKWYAADPSINGAPYLPSYTKYVPSELACPTPNGGSGRAADPIQHAVAYGPTAASNDLDAVTSLAPKYLALGQIVPFEVQIAVSGSTTPENGVIQFTGGWKTHTTSGSDFGYDPSHSVYCAFVDTKDPGTSDAGTLAKVDFWSFVLANLGTTNEEMQGTFQLSGLDDGDTIVLEVWVVLKSTVPVGASGNVQTRLIGAQTATGDNISTGNQTVPLLRVKEFFTGEADVSVTKSDGAGLVTAGQSLTYAIDVTNNSADTTANGIVITDQLDPNTTYVSASGATCTEASATITCSVGSLSPGQTKSILLTVLVAATAPTDGSITSGTCVSGDAGVDICNIVSTAAITTDPSTSNNVDSEPTDAKASAAYSSLVWTSSSTYVAFEDLKNVAWSDWDYNDFIVRIDSEKGLTPDGNVAALRLNYTGMSRGAAMDHQFLQRLPLEGGGTYSLKVNDGEGTNILQESGTFGADASFSIFAHTWQVLRPLAELGKAKPFTNTDPEQVSNVNGHTAELTIALNDEWANPDAVMPPAPWDPYIFVYNTNQEVHIVQPGYLDNTQVVNDRYDANNPLLGYDLPMAHAFTIDWDWPVEGKGVWRGYPDYVLNVGSGGTTHLDWPLPVNADDRFIWPVPPGPVAASMGAYDDLSSRYFASPVIEDLDQDGNFEVVIGNFLLNQIEVYDSTGVMASGWPRAVGGGVKAAAAVADLDRDGDREIVVGASDGVLYAFHHDGTDVIGWPVSIGVSGDEIHRILSTPALGDLDGDDQLDIVISLSDGRLHALNVDGAPKIGFPVSIGEVADKFGSQVINSSPRIADLDGDNRPEIIVGSYDKNLYVFDNTGQKRWSYETGDAILSTPAIAEIDETQPGLEIAFGSGDSLVYVLNADGSLVWRRRTGWTVRSSPLIADLDGDSKVEIVIGSDDDKVYAWHHDGKPVAGWPQNVGTDVFSSPAFGDVDGDGQAEIVVGSDGAKVYAWHRDGTLADGWPRDTTLSVKGAPAVANLDDDVELEVVVGDFGGQLHFWGTPAPAFHLFLANVMAGTPATQ